MNTSIIIYIDLYPDINFNKYNILEKLKSNKKIKATINEILTTQYYIGILWFMFIFVVIPLFFISTNDRQVQFIIDLCLLTILTTGIYICTILNNPFIKSPVSLDFKIYNDLINTITTSNSTKQRNYK